MYPWGPFSQIPSTTHVSSSQTSSTPPHEASSTGWDKSVQLGTAKTPNTVAFEGARALRRPITSASYATPESVWMLKSCSTTHSGTTMKKPPHAPQGNYQYDPLNRLIISNTTRRFYQNERIATEIEGTNARRFMAFDVQPLAVQQGQATTLLATDQKTSVLQHVSAAGTHACAYTPFGHHPVENGITRLLAFNGERPEAVTGHYLLGKGYRAYNPVLMRFNSPDSWSPFAKGGINAYAAFDNNAPNTIDQDGHFPIKIPNLVKAFQNIFMGRVSSRVMKQARARATNLDDILSTRPLPFEQNAPLDTGADAFTGRRHPRLERRGNIYSPEGIQAREDVQHFLNLHNSLNGPTINAPSSTSTPRLSSSSSRSVAPEIYMGPPPPYEPPPNYYKTVILAAKPDQFKPYLNSIRKSQ